MLAKNPRSTPRNFRRTLIKKTAAALILLLAAHPTVADTTFSNEFSSDFGDTAAYLQTDTFVLALKAANHYASEPRCGATVKPPCSEQAIVNQIAAAADHADIAVDEAQGAAREDRAAPDTKQQYIEMANEAIARLVHLIPQQ